MKNHQIRPTGSVPFPEVNATRRGRGYSHGRGRGRNRGRGRGRNRGRGYSHGRGYNSNNYGYHGDHNSSNFKKIENNEKYGKEKDLKKKSFKNEENECYRCGMKGHWSRTCRTSKHLVDLYQASLKGKGKAAETNFVEHHNPLDITHLDASDFFENVDGEINHLIGNENVNID